MKTTLILAAITTLSLGTLALVRAQADDSATGNKATPAAAETGEAPTSTAGIRTDLVTERKLSGGKKTVVAIPLASVFTEDDRFFVLSRGTESATDFRETEVTLGRTDGFDVEVKTGLTTGDEVVTVSVAQLRFPACDDGSGTVCGVNGCGPASCGSTTGDCPVDGKDGSTCKVGGSCEEGKACAVTCTDGETCKAGAACEDGETCTVACSECATCKAGAACEEGETCTVAGSDCATCKTGVACVDCPTEVDLTIPAEEFFNGSVEVIYEPASFIGLPPMFPAY